MTRRDQNTPPRPGSYTDRMIKRYGERLGNVVVYASLVAFTVVMIVFLIPIGFCAWLTYDSARSISPAAQVVTIGTALVGFLYFFWRLRADFREDEEIDFYEFLDRYFEVQVGIAIFTFYQIVFWMHDPANPNHEPRSTFLAATSAALIYFKGQISARVRRLFDLRLEAADLDVTSVLPFTDVTDHKT